MSDQPPVQTERPDAGAQPAPSRPAAPWGDFLHNVMGILLRPTRTWQRLNAEQPSVGRLFWPHLIILILLRSVVEMAGGLIQGNRFVLTLWQFVLGAAAWFAVAWLFGMIVTSYASTLRLRTTVGDGLRFAIFGMTPLFIVGIITALIPVPLVVTLTDLVLMPYTFYVLSLGVTTLLQVPAERAPTFVAVVNGLILLLVGLLPILVRSVLPTLVQAIVAGNPAP